MNNDLISRSALKKQVQELLELAVKRVDDTPNNSPCYRMYVAQENERARLIDLIDNAPTVEPTFGVFKAICCEDCDKRPQGEWKLDSIGAYCSECKTHPDYTSSFCPNCGADMRKGGAE